MDDHADVIVAGAGPVGLTAALGLANAGVRVLVLERRDTLNTASLASTIHPPTLEILDGFGLLRAVMHLGHRAGTIQYRAPDGVFAEFHMAGLAPETPFPFRLHLEQSRITPAIVARLAARPNAGIRFGSPVSAVAQGDEGVAVTVAGHASPLRARYLLAADGARSTVRDALGIGFAGIDYPDQILRIMTTDDLDAVLPGLASIAYLFNGARSISFLRMPDCWRIILRVPADIPREVAMDEAWILSRLRAVLPAWPGLPRIAGMDMYGASRRVADRFRQGRAYLMGDAAHVTSTRGGMNMNCGMHDAAAMARALVQAVRTGNAAPADAAADERRRIATDCLIPRTDRNVSGGPAWTDTLRRTAADPAASLAYLRTAAMLDMLDRSPAHA